MPYNYSVFAHEKKYLHCVVFETETETLSSWRTRIMRVSPEPMSYARDFSQCASRSRR